MIKSLKDLLDKLSRFTNSLVYDGGICKRLNSVDINSVESIVQKANELLEHSKRHFKEEETLMQLYGYPTIREHTDEHTKVLAELEYFIRNSHSMFGKKMLKAYYIEKLPEWFDLHLISMDSDLSSFLKKAKGN
jgi:hemerythrin-like metal-binding protein